MQLMIVGVSRNAHRTVERAYEKLSKFDFLTNASWVVVDSNSSESSKSEMLRLSQTRNNLDIIFLDNDAPQISRTSRIARARDSYVEVIKKNRPDKVIVIDFDPLLINYVKIPHEIIKQKTLTIYTARQVLFYYDIFAFREVAGHGQDFTDNRYFASSVIHWLSKTIPKQISLSIRSNKQMEVASAFGGLAIYPGEFFQQASYDFGAQSENNCEHVALHETAAKHGYKCVVEPKLIYGIANEHYFLFAPVAKIVRLFRNQISTKIIRD